MKECKTYKTFQSAKMENPDMDVYVVSLPCGGVFTCYYDIHEAYPDAQKCNPADYCMTVEKFLADGHKFVEGDVIYSSPLSKVIPVLRDGEFGVSYPVDGANNPMSSDDNRYILRAAALEGKPNKFVKVEESIFDLKGEFENGELYYYQCGEYLKITDTRQLAVHAHYKSAYRQVEIDWRDEVADFTGLGKVFYTWVDSINDMYDFNFIEMCHLVASLTEKPTN